METHPKTIENLWKTPRRPSKTVPFRAARPHRDLRRALREQLLPQGAPHIAHEGIFRAIPVRNGAVNEVLVEFRAAKDLPQVEMLQIHQQLVLLGHVEAQEVHQQEDRGEPRSSESAAKGTLMA